jgi:hypothetical protein
MATGRAGDTNESIRRGGSRRDRRKSSGQQEQTEERALHVRLLSDRLREDSTTPHQGRRVVLRPAQTTKLVARASPR